MADVPLLPSLVAVIVADPAAWPATSPPLFTVAIDVLLLTHVTTRPVSVLPAASLVTAESCCVAPTAMVADVGVTVTEATGTTVTVTVEVELLPSLVAVMVAEPAATPVTTPTFTCPLAVTVATPALLVAHITARPLNGLPAASRRVAVSCIVPPTATLPVAGLMLTDATGTRFTVTAALPALPSLVAIIVTAPAATPVTRPVEDTVAVAGALDAHVVVRPESTLPAASIGLAASCRLDPTNTSAVGGLIVTEATGTFVTVTAVDPVFPSLVAVIVAVPAATA